MTAAAAPKPRANVLEVAVFSRAWAGWQSRRFWRLFLTRETQSGAEGTAVQTLARNLDSLGLHGVFTAARRATGHWELRAQGVPLSGVFVPHLHSTELAIRLTAFILPFAPRDKPIIGRDCPFLAPGGDDSLLRVHIVCHNPVPKVLP